MCLPNKAVHKEAATHESFVIANAIARHTKPFSDGAFLKQCMTDVANIVCPESKQKLESVSLSRWTIAHHIEDIDADLESQPNKVTSFAWYSLALDGSTDIVDTALLLIFMRGVNDLLEITEELLSMESMKDTTTGEDLFACVSVCIDLIQLPWEKLISMTTDRCLSLTGKNGKRWFIEENKWQSY